MRNERGATATEYALLMAFIVLVIVLGIQLFGSALNNTFQWLADAVEDIFT